jgi:hypothetical protein
MKTPGIAFLEFLILSMGIFNFACLIVLYHIQTAASTLINCKGKGTVYTYPKVYNTLESFTTSVHLRVVVILLYSAKLQSFFADSIS